MAEEANTIQQIAGGLDPFDSPIPGESLTQAKESPMPYETPPTLNTPEEVVMSIWHRVRDNDEILDGILDNMRDEVPLEDIAQVLLFEGFRQGEFNPDVLLLSIEPTIYLLAFLANYAEIPAVIYPEEDFDDEDETDQAFAEATMRMELEDLPDTLKIGSTVLQRPSTIPSSLLNAEELPQRGGQ